MERRAFVGRYMVGLVALDLVLRRIGRGVVRIALVVEVARMNGDDAARHAPGLGIPADMIPDLETAAQVEAPAPWALVHVPTAAAVGGDRLDHARRRQILGGFAVEPPVVRMGESRQGRAMGLTCVFSREAVRMPAAPETSCDASPASDGTLNCHGYGSAVAVTATFGMSAAGWVLKKIASSC